MARAWSARLFTPTCGACSWRSWQLRSERADWHGADALAKWLLQFDPFNDEATLTVAECMAINGSKVEAVAFIDRYLRNLAPMQATFGCPPRCSGGASRSRSTAGSGRRARGASSDTSSGEKTLMSDVTLEMRRAKWGDGGATVLVGPPGMGKTRVTHELSTVAGIEGLRVVRVECRQSEQHAHSRFASTWWRT